jgi:hypothetical protein
MLLGHEDSLVGDVHNDEPQPPSEEIESEEPIVSFHAFHSNPKQYIMRFKGEIGHKPVCALIDSGSTHSFVDQIVLTDQNIVIKETSFNCNGR